MSDDMKIDDCWNRIGVWAKSGARCQRLPEFIHCRNCDVYSTAGQTLLERQIPQETRRQWAELYARPLERSGRLGTSFTVFRINSEWLSLQTTALKSITAPVPVRRIPHRSNPVLRGMANLAGELELVISLAALIGIDPASEPAFQRIEDQRHRPIPRILRVTGASGTFAFEAAEVYGTYRFEESLLGPVPSTLDKAMQRYVRGTMVVNGSRVGVLDLELVIYGMEQSLK